MILEAVQIKKFYGQPSKFLEVLKGIDLKVEAGDVISIAGPSGAGKSTLLHILGGLDTPTEGRVVLDGEDVYRLKDRDRARIRNEKFGFVFQFYHLLPEFNALENVLLPLMVRDNRSGIKGIRQRGEDLLESVGLKERMTHMPQQLSGGEQQRVAIARALVNQPRILFCDEPTGNLDSQSGAGIIDLLLGLNATNGQTLLIVTHDDAIAKKSRRVFHIHDGLMT